MRQFRYLLFVLLMLPLLATDQLTAAPLPLPKQKDKSSNQPAARIGAKLPLRAALILTPEFCATQWTTGNRWTSEKLSYTVGQAACEYFEPALRNSFSTLTRLEAAPSSADAQVVLQPKVLNADATKGGKREMVVLFEWTVTDTSGKTIWVQTVQGSAKHKRGNAFSSKKHFHLLLEDAVKNAAEESAREMSAAPELRSLAGDHAELQ